MQDMQFINGEYISSASGKKIDVIDPSNGRVYHQVSAGNAEDIDKAVKAARAAFDDGPWPKMSGRERAAILRKMGDIINERVNELAKLEVQNNGKPLPEAVWDIEDTAGCFHFYADLAEELDQDNF